MKAKELLQALLELSQEALELPVYVIADHGQTPSGAHTAGVERVTEESGELVDDYDDYEAEDILEVFLVGD